MKGVTIVAGIEELLTLHPWIIIGFRKHISYRKTIQQ
jgi:hypothetical protein